MRWFRIFVGVLLFLVFVSYSYSENLGVYENLKPGKYPVGFQLLEKTDFSRVYPTGASGELSPRKIRVYLWYPAKSASKQPLMVRDYVDMAAADFYSPMRERMNDSSLLPTQLKKGLSKELLDKILKKNTIAGKDSAAAKGPFPLLVLGQGLYYESPLTHFVLCEYLASHGYVVGTCPLVGTQYRLVNISARDIETHIRDLEFVLGQARQLPFVDLDKIGAVGYDLGGMAAILLVMRHPVVKVFLSLDSGINYEHFSHLPKNHPSYREKAFTVPWMHMIQARFMDYFRSQKNQSSLFERRTYGPGYLVEVPSSSHACVTSYAALGLENPVAGYWGPIEKNLRELHVEVCGLALLFLDAHLKGDGDSLAMLSRRVKTEKEALLKMEFKGGKEPPPATDVSIHGIIDLGMDKARPVIDGLMGRFPSADLFEEEELNWLGYHFLFWWDRPQEALAVFKLNTELFPESANAFDSLGEAYLIIGEKEKAIESYRKSLKLNPENKNAAVVLKRLTESKE